MRQGEVNKMKCGEKIKYYREAIAMSQDELAQKTGYAGRSAISRIESGERDLSQIRIKQFAQALGVSPLDLLDDREPQPVEVDPVSRERRKLIEFIEQLDESRLPTYAEILALPVERLEAILRAIKG